MVIAGYTIGTGKLTVGDSPGVNISGSGGGFPVLP